ALDMSDHPLEQLDSAFPGSASPNNTLCVRKRDKVHDFLGIPKSRSKDVSPTGSNLSSHSRTPSQQSTRPSSVVSQVSNDPPGHNQSVVSPPVIREAKLLSSLQLLAPNKAQVVVDIFPDNVPKPVIKTELPRLQERIESTEQLVYCTSLLLQDSLSAAAVPGSDVASDTALCLQSSTLDKAELDWLEEIKRDPMEQDHLRWLLTRMVEAFVADTTKDSAELAEIVALGPVLQKEPYRKLVSSLIKAFDDAHILDDYLLQGLIQLIQAASPEYLEADDLVRILSILRVRLQGTHQQSAEHSYHLILAVSIVLDVMADHKVQGLDRVLQHEPLSGVLSGLKGSSDPYIMYQACYAFQALQYVPDDESALQAILRHSTGMVDGLVKVSAVFRLDLASVLEGLGSLQESLGGAVGVASTVYKGASSLMASGQGVFDSLKEGLSTGQKRPWYPAIKAAYAFAQAGQLKDLRQLIFEAPCRHDPLFQWGICQLLGEVSYNPIWAVATRQQAITLLTHLFKVDRDWGRDDIVKAWMMTIVTKLGATSDHAVNTVAYALLQDIDQDRTVSIQHPYTLTTHFPIPASSPILTKVHSISSVEFDLHKLRLQRLKDARLPVYIPPMAKANLQARDDDLFPLMDKVQEFLASDRQVMLILGDPGSGKSTFNMHLESELIRTYTHGGPIALFINLPAIDEPQQDMIEKQLKIYNFSDDQIMELKQHRQLVLICDGYDESQQLVNLHKTNFLNQPGQWNTKMVISCRSQYLGQDYRSRFIPQGGSHYARPALELFQEAAITPFSKEQIVQYIEQYVPLEPRTWITQDYMNKLDIIPNLMDLVKNPFVLTLALEALPLVVEGKKELSTIKITRVQLYDTFVVHWLDVNKRRLENMPLSDQDRGMLDQLLDAGFISMGTEYSTNLASAIFEKQNGNPVVQYTHLKDKKSWKAEFFSPDPEIRLLRESSPLSRTGSLFRFLHRSMQEYFYSRTVFDPSTQVENDRFSPQPDPDSTLAQSPDPQGSLFKCDLLTEPSVIQFLCERVKQHSDFKKQLLSVIEQSKTDPTVTRAATNAITILVRAGVLFNGADLRGIKIPKADLSNGQFDSAQLQGADLKGVNFARSWLRQADLSGAQMDDVRFGELPFLKEDDRVIVCAYSHNGRMLAVGGQASALSIYDTTTWNRGYHHSIDGGWIIRAAFSPNNQQLIYGTSEHNVRLWSFANNDTVLDMEGHTGIVTSVAFSPCGKQLASASKDKTVRLWSSETGECVFVLKGHTDVVAGVAYCADGKRLVSGSSGDGKVRVWDPETGKSVSCWNITQSKKNSTLTFSADGQWVAVALEGKVQITNAVTAEPGPVLNNSGNVDCIAFSSNGQWIITSNYDGDSTLRLWDSSGRLICSFPGHAHWIYTCTFSPDCSQIASGDHGGYVRLWEVDTSRAILYSGRTTSPVRTVTYSPDGRSILSSSYGQGVQQWDSLTGVSASLPLKLADNVSSLSLSPDCSQIATGHRDGISLWKSLIASVSFPLKVADNVWSLTLSPDGNQIATGHNDGTIRLWSRQANAVERTLLGHTNSVL
ncbi:hypothetical protein BGW39_001133, partial [Mortierella sp. 14UC]